MSIQSSNKKQNSLGSVSTKLSFIRRALFVGLLVSLIWLPGLFTNPAAAMQNIAAAMPEGITAQNVDFSEGDRLKALVGCLPKQLSEPSLKRALSEMGNDQIERAFNLKVNPKLSEAETKLQNCLSRKG
jgi:hypothetical protein